MPLESAGKGQLALAVIGVLGGTFLGKDEADDCSAKCVYSPNRNSPCCS